MFKHASYEVGSEGTTPHLVWVEHLRIFLSQSIDQIQALFDFENFLWGYPFLIFHRSLDPSLSPQKCKDQFFCSCFIFCHMCLGCRRCDVAAMSLFLGFARCRRCDVTVMSLFLGFARCRRCDVTAMSFYAF